MQVLVVTSAKTEDAELIAKEGKRHRYIERELEAAITPEEKRTLSEKHELTLSSGRVKVMQVFNFDDGRLPQVIRDHNDFGVIVFDLWDAARVLSKNVTDALIEYAEFVTGR